MNFPLQYPFAGQQASDAMVPQMPMQPMQPPMPYPAPMPQMPMQPQMPMPAPQAPAPQQLPPMDMDTWQREMDALQARKPQAPAAPAPAAAPAPPAAPAPAPAAPAPEERKPQPAFDSARLMDAMSAAITMGIDPRAATSPEALERMVAGKLVGDSVANQLSDEALRGVVLVAKGAPAAQPAAQAASQPAVPVADSKPAPAPWGSMVLVTKAADAGDELSKALAKGDKHPSEMYSK